MPLENGILNTKLYRPRISGDLVPRPRLLERLEVELVKLQGWIKAEVPKVGVILEGGDSAGKGGAIKRITYRLGPRVARSQPAIMSIPISPSRTLRLFRRCTHSAQYREEI